MNETFFYKERKRTQRTKRSFIKNAKERKNIAFFWKERMPHCPTLTYSDYFVEILHYGYTKLETPVPVRTLKLNNLRQG